MKNIFININSWGESYVDGLLNYTLPCLLFNIKEIDKNELLRIKLCICTDNKSLIKIKKDTQFNRLNNLINCEIIKIDNLLKTLPKETSNKYQLLACIQNLLINYAFKKKYKFFMTLYPDFIFKKNTLKNMLSIIDDKNCDILIPIPQLIKENIIDYINDNSLNSLLDNLTEINFKFFHDIITHNDINDLKTNTPSLFCQIEKNYINFSNYHIHPIIIKLNKNRFKYTPFTKSLDEDFIKSLEYEEEFYITQNSQELLINSLLGKNEIKIINQDYDEGLAKKWLSSMMYEINKKFSSSVYTITNKDITKISTVKLKKFIKNINKNLKVKNKSNSYDDNLFYANSYFPNIRNFLFEIQQHHDKINISKFNNLISKYNLQKYKSFLKIFN